MMDGNSMMGLMDVIIVGAGLYMLYGYYLLMAKNEIKEGVMVSKANSGKKCKDMEGFKREMGPRALIFALIAILSGAVGLIQDYVTAVPAAVYWACYVLFCAAIVWFVLVAKKLEKKYF